MHMVRHDHVPAYGPAMALVRSAPLIDQNLRGFISRQHRSTIVCAHCDEMNRRIQPDSTESPQMFVHCVVVAWLADIGHPTCCHTREPRSATRGYSGAHSGIVAGVADPGLGAITSQIAAVSDTRLQLRLQRFVIHHSHHLCHLYDPWLGFTEGN
jgi:hypothetical protein